MAPQQPPITISGTGALVPLLGVAGITVAAILGFIETQPPYVPNEGVMAAVPHSPSEFPAVFGHDEALEGLDAGIPDGGLVPTAMPPFSDGVFPCMDCHGDPDQPPNPQRRKLEDAHTKIVLRHDEEHRWCLDCHDLKDRDQLKLASGELVPFTESYKLCGQCHGPQYRDWKLGIHGKRTGFWNGNKRYLLCVNCHWPHDPHFAPLKPLPPPVRPHYLRAEDRPAPGVEGKVEGKASEKPAGSVEARAAAAKDEKDLKAEEKKAAEKKEEAGHGK
jgi:hypothetical protein